MSTFQKAQRHKAKARFGIAGPSGSGKTYTALRIAAAWAAAAGGRFAVIDTEPVGPNVGSASLYADAFDFDTLLLHPPYHPKRFAEAIREAAEAGYVVTVVDGITPAWDGDGGVQQIVEKAGGEFRHWGSHGNPAHQILIDAITNAPNHIITTMRSKMTYAMEEVERANGFKKSTVKKLGMRPIQRDTIEYEHSIFGQVDEQHTLTITKSRFAEIQDKTFPKAGEEFAAIVLGWLEGGAPEPAPDRRVVILERLKAMGERVHELKRLLGVESTGKQAVDEIVAAMGDDDDPQRVLDRLRQAEADSFERDVVEPAVEAAETRESEPLPPLAPSVLGGEVADVNGVDLAAIPAYGSEPDVPARRRTRSRA